MREYHPRLGLLSFKCDDIARCRRRKKVVPLVNLPCSLIIAVTMDRSLKTTRSRTRAIFVTTASLPDHHEFT